MGRVSRASAARSSSSRGAWYEGEVRRTPWCARILATAILGLGGSAWAGPLTMEAYVEDVRFDLETRRFLTAGRPEGPTRPEDFRLTSPARFRAVRDEVIAFQLLIDGPAGPQRIVVEPCVSGTSSVGPEVSVFQAHGIRITAPTESDFIYSLGPGLYPGPLQPTRTATVPETGVAMLWVDVFVPRTLAAGVYKGAVRVGSERFAFELDVLDLELPRVDAARLGTVNFGSLIFRDQKQPGLQLAWMQMAHAHGVSVELMRPTPKVADDGTIDWEGWADRIGPYIDGSAFSAAAGYRGPRADLPTTRFIIPLTDWWPDKAQDRLPSKPERWSRTLREWEQFVKGKGWFDHPQATRWVLFVNSLDEPHDAETIQTLAKYGPLLDAAQLEDRRRVWFRIDGNWGQKIEGYAILLILKSKLILNKIQWICKKELI